MILRNYWTDDVYMAFLELMYVNDLINLKNKIPVSRYWYKNIWFLLYPLIWVGELHIYKVGKRGVL